MKVLIPAAGQSIRYADKGYAIRKPFLTIKDRLGRVDTMLGHVVRHIPAGMEIYIGIPQGYTYVDRYDRKPTIAEIEQTESQIETIFRMLSMDKNWRANAPILIIDADTIAPIAGMLEFIEYEQPDMAVAVTQHPDEWMGRVSRDFVFSEGKASGEYGIIGMRYFNSSHKLYDTINDVKGTFSDIMNKYEWNKKGLYFVQWYEDWGTPDKLIAAGATIA
jgi:hypothetical protein